MYQITAQKLIRFFTAVTFGIVFVLSVCYLVIVRQNLLSSQNLAFRENTVQTLRSLQNQDILTADWIQNAEANGRYYLLIADNGIDSFYTKRVKKSMGTIWTELESYYNEKIASAEHPTDQLMYLDGISSYTIFTCTPTNSTPHLVCHARIPKSTGVLVVWIIDPQTRTYQQFYQTVAAFLCLAFLALICLYYFFRRFIHKLLLPLEENYETQKQFVSNASHELRTPLTVILSSASACMKSDNAQQKSAFLETIQREGQRMARLINDLLTLTRFDNQTCHLDKQQTDLVTLILNSYEAFWPVAMQKKQTLILDLPEEDLVYCCCDENRMAQALAILLHNAVSYTPAGGQIRLTLRLTDLMFEIHVEDNGPGVPDDEKEKIFERFYRSDQARSSKEHFGLGLAIALEIIKMHDGTIRAEDAAKGGSVFVISLPNNQF